MLEQVLRKIQKSGGNHDFCTALDNHGGIEMTGIERVEWERADKMQRRVKEWMLRCSMDIYSRQNLPMTNIFNDQAVYLLTQFGLFLDEGRQQ